MSTEARIEKDQQGNYYGIIREQNNQDYLICPLCNKMICTITGLYSEPCHNCKIRVVPPKEYSEEFSLF
ncbi:MAG: hypothetical protein ACFFDT_31780 [Candidatus Hodarchaeota archaeon]